MKLEDVYKTFPSGATEDYKILRAFEMGKQEGGAKVKELEAQIEKMKCCGNCKHYTTFNNACMEYGYFLDRCDKTKWEIKEE